MRRSGLAIALAASVALGALRADAAICRPAVHAAAGRLQAARPSARRHGRIADHRRNGRAARRLDRPGARQHRRRASGAAGGARRQGHRSSSTATSFRASTAQELADVERLNFAVDESIVDSQISRRLSSDQARQGPRLDAWRQDAVQLGQKTGYDYALFLHAEDQVASGGPDRAWSARARRLHRRLLRAQRRRRSSSSITPRSSISRPARSSGSTSSSREARCRGSSSATCGPRKARRRWSSGCSGG